MTEALQTSEHPLAKKLWLYRKLSWAGELTLTLLITLVLIGTGASQDWANLAQSRFDAWWSRALVFAAMLAIAYGLPTAPLGWVRFRIEKKFGLSTQSPAQWLADQLKGALLGAVLGSIVVLGLAATLIHSGDRWWWIASIGATLFGVVLTRIAPQIIVPLFFKMKPLNSPELQSRFSRLAASTGTPVLGIFEIDLSSKTTAANAAVLGFGHSRRAVVGDTLLKSFSDDEIEFVLAHELAHHKYHDLWTGIAVGTVLTTASLALSNGILQIPALALLPVNPKNFNPLALYGIALITSVAGFVLGPIAKLFSRIAETRADRFAAFATHKSRSGIDAFRKLGFQNLARFRPPIVEELLMHTHPCIARRIERLERIASAD